MITTEQMTQNILAVHDKATPTNLRDGLLWYPTAHEIAAALGARFDRDIVQVAGVIAALSPMNSWGSNINLATRLLKADGELHTGYLGAGLTKARDAYRSDSPNDTRNLLVGGKTGRGWKIGAFFDCIVWRGDTDQVCVDRHAIDIAFGTRHSDAERPRVGAPLYRQLAAAYNAAGKECDITGPTMQAITWVTWRDLHHTENEAALFNTVSLD